MHGKYYEKIVPVTHPVSINGASATTAEIDTLGYTHMVYAVHFGSIGADVAALALTESDTAGSGHANITGCVCATSTDYAGAATTLPVATTDNNKMIIFEVDLRGRKRYIDSTITAGAGATLVQAAAYLTRAADAPVTPTQRGVRTIFRV